MLSFIKTQNTIELVLDGAAHSIHSSNQLYSKVVDALRQKDVDTLATLLDRIKFLQDDVKAFEILTDDFGTKGVYLQGHQIHGTMVDRLLELVDLGIDETPIVNFIQNIHENPDESGYLVEDLYTFLEYGKLPLTSDGCFLAYKVVRSDYKDKHTGTIDNSVGRRVFIDRGIVDTDRTHTCSTGLHFCSSEYVKGFLYGAGDRILIVKVNPKDVVSIPVDYNNTKARCCSYIVVDDVTDGLADKALNDVSVEEQYDAPEHVDPLPDDPERCPECDSDHVQRRGITSRFGERYQRYVCRDCGENYYVSVEE